MKNEISFEVWWLSTAFKKWQFHSKYKTAKEAIKHRDEFKTKEPWLEFVAIKKSFTML